MRRGIAYAITTGMTFYMALLFESRSLLMIGILEIFIFLLAVLYYIGLAGRLWVEADAECEANALQDGYTLWLKVQNKSRLPVNKMRIKLIEENVYQNKKRKAILTMPVSTRGLQKDKQKEMTKVQVKWYPKKAGLYRIKVKRVFVSDWFGVLEIPLFRKNAKDIVEVMMLPKKQEIFFECSEESRIEEQAMESFYPMTEDTDGEWEYRDYQNGDKMHHIHWKLSAKARNWIVHYQKAERRAELVLFIEMSAREKDSKKKSKKQIQKNREAFLSLIYSSMLGLLNAGYPHKVIWYDQRKKKLCQYAVDTTSKAMRLLTMLEGLWSRKKTVSAMEQYHLENTGYNKYTGLILSPDLTLANDRGMTIAFQADRLTDPKKSRKRKKTEQETEEKEEQILYL